MITSLVVAFAVQASQPEVRPTFWLDVDPRPSLAGRLGPTSYIAGAPFLPSNETWPRYENGEAYSFLGQVNLSERPALDDDPLPDDGLLLFFGYQGFFGADIMTTVRYVPSDDIPRSPHRDLSTAPEVVATWLEPGEDQIAFAHPITIFADQSVMWTRPEETFDFGLSQQLVEQQAERRREIFASAEGLAPPREALNSGSFNAPPAPSTWIDVKRIMRQIDHDHAAMWCFLDQQGELADQVGPTFARARRVLSEISRRWRSQDSSQDWELLPSDTRQILYQDLDRVYELGTELFPLHFDLQFSQRGDAIDTFGEACVDDLVRFPFDRSKEATLYTLRQAIVEGRDARALYGDVAVASRAPIPQERIGSMRSFYPRTEMLGFGWSFQSGPFDNIDNVLLLQIDGVHHPMIGDYGCVLHFWITPNHLAAMDFDQTFSTWECD